MTKSILETIERNQTNADILVAFFGWRWLLGKSDKYIALHPPANNIFNLTLMNSNFIPGFYTDVTDKHK